MEQTRHVTVLLNETVQGVLDGLDSTACGIVVDGTLGGGGHLRLTLDELERRGASKVHVCAFDRDLEAVERGKERFTAEIRAKRLEIVHGAFSSLAEHLPSGEPLIAFYADLGFSSDQIESADRGMSFQRPGPLDMRLDPSQGEPVSALLEKVGEKELARILSEWGEERFSERIARYWIHDRTQGKHPQTTIEFADWMARIIPRKFHERRIHPATRTFQALRIWVNDEIGELERGLRSVFERLQSKGKMGFISFHSLEDRAVKNFFSQLEKEGVLKRVTRKAILPTREEVEQNKRSRSAKLRIGEKR